MLDAGFPILRLFSGEGWVSLQRPVNDCDARISALGPILRAVKDAGNLDRVRLDLIDDDIR